MRKKGQKETGEKKKTLKKRKEGKEGKERRRTTSPPINIFVYATDSSTVQEKATVGSCR